MTHATMAHGVQRDASPYLEDVVKKFALAATFWGVVGFIVGDYIAFQLAYPVLNLDLEWFSFGRLRPLHTSAVIFAFGGNVLLGTSFYVVQRTCRASLFGGRRWPTSSSGATSCSSSWPASAMCWA